MYLARLVEIQRKHPSYPCGDGDDLEWLLRTLDDALKVIEAGRWVCKKIDDENCWVEDLRVAIDRFDSN